MVDEVSLNNFIKSGLYDSLLSTASLNQKISINPDEPSGVLLRHDINKINLAKLSIQEMEQTVSNNKALFFKFLDEKLKTFIETPDEQDNNYDSDDIIETLPFYRNFLIIHMIEFCILTNSSECLDVYVKKIKIPNNKKYESKLREIYSNLGGKGEK